MTHTDTHRQLTHDGPVAIATGRSRKSTNWVNQTILWSELTAKVQRTRRTAETFQDYMAMSKDRQDDIKDVGGFVGGTVRNGRRGRTDIENRTVVALDADHASSIDELLEELDMMLGCAYAWHTTHKHHPKRPRFRILIPLTRAVSPDEYEALARKIASLIDIESFDDTTYETNRLMYYPSTSDDGEFRSGANDAPWVQPDAILNLYGDWRDRSQWPQSTRETKVITERRNQQEDPLLKTGWIGAFCREYDIHDAIATFIPDTYEQVHDNRYTYSGGTTSCGMVTYSDKYAYSHHSTDPTQGQLFNAFDLIRIHRFGTLDEGRDGTETDKLPSYAAMMDFIRADRRTAERMDQERLQEIDQQFTELPEDMTDETREALFFKDGKFITRYMAEWYLHRQHAFVLRDELYIYRDGRYIHAEKDFRERATNALRDDFQSRRLTETMHYMKNILPDIQPDDATSMHGHINVQNGLIHLDTMQFRTHTPELKTIMQLPVRYDPQATCPNFETFLQQVIPDECIPILQEMFGYCLLPTMRYEKSFLFYGEGGNGKGTVIAVMQRFFGEANASNVALQTLGDNRFAAASLFGKMVNLHADIPNRLIEDSSLFKELTSGDRIQAEEKHKAAFTFNNRAKLVFSANELPSSRDNSEGFHRRWVVIPFPHKFNDRELRARLFSDDEMSGILNWAIEGARRLAEQDGFSESQAVNEKVQDYREKSDSVYHFLRERCEAGTASDEISKQKLYDAYRSACNDWGVHGVSQMNFNQRVKVVYKPVKECRVGKTRCWRGIRYNDQHEIDTDFLN